MINFLRGRVRSIEENTVTLEVHGVGFELMSPSAGTLSIDQEIEMYSYLHWSSENGPSFYGFSTLQERQVFLLILKCQGIGPKIAITILEQMSPAPFLQAILNGSLDALTALHGIGTKKAEQLIMQLRSPAEKLLSSGKISASQLSGGLQWKELSDALQSLNYSRQEITQVLAALRQQAPTDSFDQLLRKSLSLLAKR